MNHSIYSADQGTHFKIVVVALVAVIAFASFVFSSRNSLSVSAQTAGVIKAGKPTALSSSSIAVTR